MERLAPLDVFGRPWSALTYAEQVELLGYATLREAEEAQEQRATLEAMSIRKRGR